MRTYCLAVAASALICEALPAQVSWVSPGDRVTGKMLVVRSCHVADSLFGVMWRSKGQRVFVTRWDVSDRTEIEVPQRTASWQTGSSRVAGIKAETTLLGPTGPADSATLILTIRLVDSEARSSEDLRTILVLGKSDTLTLPLPTVLPESGVKVRGFPVRLIFALPDSMFRAMAASTKIAGLIGPHRFFLMGWEVHDINTLYRAVRCGAGLGSDP